MSRGSGHWKDFEKIVAAVHRAADKGAQVEWNAKIDGRQFDVVVRYRKGLYDFLIVVECRRYKQPVPVGDVEAFVTKSRGVYANRAIIASISGFQAGARKVARDHGIVLLDIAYKDIDYSDYGLKKLKTEQITKIDDISLSFRDGSIFDYPIYHNELIYYARKSIIYFGIKKFTLIEMIENELSIPFEVTDERQLVKHNLPSGYYLAPDNEENLPEGELATISYYVSLSQVDVITGKTLIDPSLILPSIEISKAESGEVHIFRLFDLPAGAHSEPEEGSFYEHPFTGMRYYIRKIEGDTLHVSLVESFQLGQLVRAEFTQRKEHFIYCEKIEDQDVIERLKKRLKTM